MKSTRQVVATLARIDDERSRVRQEALTRAAKELAAVRAMPVRCLRCGKRAALHRWTFIQHRSYTRPSGCTEGDFWSDDPAAFCHLACPACSERSYLYVRRDKEAIVAAIERVFDRQSIFDAKIITEADTQCQ